MAEQQRVTIELDNVYVTRITVSGNYTYIGRALCGSSTGDSVWQIKRIDATTGTVIQWADGDANFDNEYDNVGTITYT